MKVHTTDINLDGVKYILQWEKPEAGESEVGYIYLTEACTHKDQGDCSHEIYDFREEK